MQNISFCNKSNIIQDKYFIKMNSMKIMNLLAWVANSMVIFSASYTDPHTRTCAPSQLVVQLESLSFSLPLIMLILRLFCGLSLLVWLGATVRQTVFPPIHISLHTRFVWVLEIDFDGPLQLLPLTFSPMPLSSSCFFMMDGQTDGRMDGRMDRWTD